MGTVSSSGSNVVSRFSRAGLVQLSQGKVRDSFELSSDLLLQVATNRISIFDLVLPRLVLQKGEVLTAMTVFWLRHLLRDFPNHLVAFGQGIDEHLPEGLRGDVDLQARALVVKRLDMLMRECIVRGWLTGSGWRDYQATGEVCGHKLPEGLHDGSLLPESIFTPSTKAEVGHDVNVSAESVRQEFGLWPEKRSLAIFEAAAEFALNRGIVIADTKFEFGADGTLGDEVLTPDSSRFWDINEWRSYQDEQKSPPGFDKEPVRQWGKGVDTPWGAGLNNLDPGDPDHQNFIADGLIVPDEVVEETTGRYLSIFERLVGTSLSDFQRNSMGIGR